jgi:hypothetical protein
MFDDRMKDAPAPDHVRPAPSLYFEDQTPAVDFHEP